MNTSRVSAPWLTNVPAPAPTAPRADITPRDTLWDDADLQAFLKVRSARHFQRVKKLFSEVRVRLETETGTLVRYDPADVRAMVERMKAARPRARHIPRQPRRTT